MHQNLNFLKSAKKRRSSYTPPFRHALAGASATARKAFINRIKRSDGTTAIKPGSITTLANWRGFSPALKNPFEIDRYCASPIRWRRSLASSIAASISDPSILIRLLLFPSLAIITPPVQPPRGQLTQQLMGDIPAPKRTRTCHHRIKIGGWDRVTLPPHPNSLGRHPKFFGKAHTRPQVNYISKLHVLMNKTFSFDSQHKMFL